MLPYPPLLPPHSLHHPQQKALHRGKYEFAEGHQSDYIIQPDSPLSGKVGAAKKAHSVYLASQASLNFEKARVLEASRSLGEATRTADFERLKAEPDNQAHCFQMEMAPRARADALQAATDADARENLARIKEESDIQHRIKLAELRLVLLRKEKEENNLIQSVNQLICANF